MDASRDRPGSRTNAPPRNGNAAAPQPWEDTTTEPILRIQGLTKDFDGVTAVNGVNLDIYKGELFAILGGSGCGKTTLLRMLAGFERPTSGEILIDGTDMSRSPPFERPVNMMFQSYAVFPHMTVEQNVAYGLRKERLPRAEIRQRVDDMLSLVKLDALGRRRPHQLSGGQRQRVALARALVKRPKVLLLDEPLAALDKKLREHTQFELMNIQYELGITFIVVTHDQEEAMTLATRIAVMDQGQFVQIGTPTEIYEFPCNRFVADFFGTVNIFSATVLECGPDRVRLRPEELPNEIVVRTEHRPETGTSAWVAVRPEKISISKERPEDPELTVVRGVVWDLAYYGNLSLYRKDHRRQGNPGQRAEPRAVGAPHCRMG